MLDKMEFFRLRKIYEKIYEKVFVNLLTMKISGANMKLRKRIRKQLESPH